MRYLVFILLILHSLSSQGQSHFNFDHAADRVSIPFRYIRNLVLVSIKINGVDLTFLLDTGVKETILFGMENELISLKNPRRLKFNGLGENDGIDAIVATQNRLEVGAKLLDTAHTIYVVLNQEFNFSTYVGVPVNGILGSHFFKDYPVEIDYVKQRMTLYRNSSLIKNKVKKFQSFPIELENSRPYIETTVQLKNSPIQAKMLVDMGNSDALLVFPSRVSGFALNEPNIDEFIGRGFNGDIHGKMSRIHSLHIGKFKFSTPTASFPDSSALRSARLVPGRVGSIGSELLRRFTVIFDYPTQTLYLKKGKYYNKPFLVDMSGVDIKHDGVTWVKDWVRVNIPKETQDLNKSKPIYEAETNDLQYKFVLKSSYSITNIRKGSPAEQSGLMKGDLIISINKRQAGALTLDQIQHMLTDDEGKMMNIVVRREGKDLRFSFRLRDPIPYQAM